MLMIPTTKRFMNSKKLKIKICGIKDVESARAVEKFDADFLGMIFYPKSHRYVDLETARQIVNSIDRSHLQIVGVFVDESIDVVNRISNELRLDFVQLHGAEDEDYARQIDSKIIKAFRIGDDFEVNRANKFPSEMVLIDTYVRGQVGGTGQSFDWTHADVENLQKDFLIAGGISIENFHRAVNIFKSKSEHFAGLDVSGSLEIDREKSPALIENFLKAFHKYDA